MANLVHLDGQLLNLTPPQLIGEGGEAEIYDIGRGRVFKLYKSPTHPDFKNDPIRQRLVADKIRELQTKLKSFPVGLPGQVITPLSLGTNDLNQAIGYSMVFLTDAEMLWQYTQRNFRQTGVLNHMVVPILRDLHQSVTKVHQVGVVIADFNGLNVLVKDSRAYLIDADSFQWGQYMVRVFSSRYVDPSLCVWSQQEGMPILNRPHNALSDWYAFNVMVMETMLLADPYQGVYRPMDPRNRIPNLMRPLKRITVFHDEVIYPKPAVPYGVLPDDLLDHFFATFNRDQRIPFPISLLDNLRWTVCTNCGTEHARPVCPNCSHVSEAAIKQKVTVRGNVTATRIFHTNGVILYATVQSGILRYLYHDGHLKREDGTTVSTSPLDSAIRYRIQGPSTLFAKKSGGLATLIVSSPGSSPIVKTTSLFGNLPVYDANAQHYFFISAGSIYRDGELGPEHVGDVLGNQTLFWVGDKLGFGFYRAEQITVAFIFNPQRRGINDTVEIPPIKGQLIDSTCVFSGERIWFFTSTQTAGQTINHCHVIGATGELIATADAIENDGSWLGTIRGKCAIGDFLLAPTDDGVVRIEVDRNQLAITKSFPDTEPFVDTGSFLFPSNDGLVVVNPHDVLVLKIT